MGSVAAFQCYLFFSKKRKGERFYSLTLEELRQFDGVQKREIFLAIKGKIYDVSSSPAYRKSSDYGVLAGHDASVNLAKMSKEEKFLDMSSKIELSEEEKETLEEWVRFFA